jgi:hypothetical protein
MATAYAVATKIVISNYASCAAILLIYACSWSGRAAIFHLLPGGIICFQISNMNLTTVERLYQLL